MNREELKEILKDLPIKFRTESGTIITITRVIAIGENSLIFLDKAGDRAYIPFSAINPPLMKAGDKHE